MTEPTRTPLYATPEPGAIVFIDVPPITTGFTDDEIQVFFTSSSVGLTAAADAKTGAMVAFIPSDEDLERFVMTNYEPLDELHITVLYFGDAADIDDQSRADLLDAIADFASRQPVFTADAFAVAAFNPAGDKPCLVIQLSGADIADARDSVVITTAESDAFDELPEQREPWIPHMTLAYDDEPLRLVTDDLQAMLPSPVVITKVRVAFAGEVHDFPLGEENLSAAAFHLAGQHNQATHGRGHLTDETVVLKEKEIKGHRKNYEKKMKGATGGTAETEFAAYDAATTSISTGAPGDRAAIGRYAGSAAGVEMNESLNAAHGEVSALEARPGSEHFSDSTDLQTSVHALDSAIDGSVLSHDVAATRVIENPEHVFGGRLKKGQDNSGLTFHSHGYTSVTTGGPDAVGLQYARLTQGGSRNPKLMTMRVLVPRGTHAVGGARYERELILGRDTQLRIVNDHGVDQWGDWHVDVEVVS